MDEPCDAMFGFFTEIYFVSFLQLPRDGEGVAAFGLFLCENYDYQGMYMGGRNTF